MTDLRLRIDDAFVGRLRETLGVTSNTDVMQEALTLLSWAVEEKERGRLILSTNQDGKQVERLAMRTLSVLSSDVVSRGRA